MIGVMDITPLQCRSPSEADLVELVEFRQMEVERLERELGALHTHCDFLVDSFSIPTYPPDDDPVAEPFGAAPVLSEYSNENGVSKAGNEDDTLPSSHDNEEMEQASPARNLEPVEILSSSTSKGAVDWSHGDDIERPGVKSPANPKISEETGTSGDDNSRFTDKESSSEEVSASSSGEEVSAGSSSEEVSASSSGEEVSAGSSSEEVSASSSSEEVSAGSSSEEGSASSSSESDDIKLVFRSKSRKIKPIFSDPEETSSSSSSASECLPKQKPSPVKIEKANISSSSSDDSEESSSSTSSSSSSSDDDDTGRNKSHAQAGRPFLGQATVPKAAPTLSLSSNASPEDFFDWMVLGLQGPWLPLASENNSSEVKDQSPLPLKFPSTAAYVAMFQKLIGEEARAILLSEWEQYTAAQDSNSMSASQSSLEYAYSEDPRALSSTWQLRSMVQTLGDPFHYLEAGWKAGPKVKFNAGEFVCMLVPGTKEVTGVALINNHDRYQAPLLRMRAPWNPSFATCILMRLCNMVTLRRMFLAVSTVSEIFAPLRQQILDPVANTKFQKLVDDDDDDDDDDGLKLQLCSEALRNFCDRNILNKLQLLTVSCLLQMRQGFQLVQGPPGTGKTSTIVGMVSTLLIEEPGVRILVCAPSNAALDEVAARLMHRMIDKAGNIYTPMIGAMVRFGSRRVMHPLVHMISLDSLSLKVSSRSWVDILDAASIVCATLSGCGNSTFDELKKKFDVIIIDEAAQAVEAEVLIALQRARGRCVMVGDPQQLPATVFQRPSTAYGRSLFERFQEGGVPVTMLKNQYRMHPSISRYPSQKFYSGALQNAGHTLSMRSIFTPKRVSIRGHTFKLTPYTFIDVNWSTDLLQNHSRANHEEALVVCTTVEAITKGLNSGVKPDIGVITPYLAQRFVIQKELGRRGIEAEVNTVDGFQGREKDVVVLSCVRAVADRGVGFVADEKRMNVALTRARFCLVVVGCAATLRRWSPAWAALIDDARARGCFQVLRSLDVSRNRKQSFTPRRDLHVENKRKRSLDCTDGERPHKKMGYSKLIKAGTERRS